MTADSYQWVVVSDFDGTITRKDIGNELCLKVFPDHFKKIHKRYKAGELDLRSMQKILWTGFPLSERAFRDAAYELSELREGANLFLEKCYDARIPVYVASCGLIPYIDEVLKRRLSSKAYAAIKEVRANEASFDHEKISVFTAPDADEKSALPLDKGAWCRKLKQLHGSSTQVFGIGNGSSDRSFKGCVDELAATEALIDWCKANNQPCREFESFHDIMNMNILPL